MVLKNDLFFKFKWKDLLEEHLPGRKYKIEYIHVYAPVFQMSHLKYFYVLEKRRDDFDGKNIYLTFGIYQEINSYFYFFILLTQGHRIFIFISLCLRYGANAILLDSHYHIDLTWFLQIENSCTHIFTSSSLNNTTVIVHTQLIRCSL